MNSYKMVELGTVIHQAKTVRCGDGDYPVLSMTMHDGLVFQDDKFKKVIASQDRSDYKVVYRNQLVISFPIDEGVLAAQRIVDAGIVSPAYGIWDIDQEQILPEFLECALRCNRALSYYKAKLRGSTARRRSLPTPTLLAFTIPLPSLQEQQRILDVVHKAKGVIDIRKEQITELDILVKARFVEMFGDPVSNAKAWQMRPLKETCALMTGNTPSRAVKEYYGSYIEWIKSDNIANSSLYLTAAAESLSEKGAEVGRVVHPGTILMTCIAGSLNTIGNVAIVDRDVAFNQQINAIIPHQYDTLFLCYLLKLLKPKLHEAASSALKCILNKGNLEAFTAIVPDMALQKEFSSFVVQSDKSKFSLANSVKQLHFVVECIWRSLCKEMRIWPISSF